MPDQKNLIQSQTRRSILAGLAAILPAAVAAPAVGASLATSGQTDSRLIELGRQLLALRGRLDALTGDWSDEQLDDICSQIWAIEHEIERTQAQSLAGLIVKLDAAQAEINRQVSGSGTAETAFADLCETIRTLALTASPKAVAA